SNPDGTLVDRAAFLEQTARPVTISNLQAEDVNVRLMGDFAIIHARTTYLTADGTPASGRYTDVWARRDGQWLCVSAHVTRGQRPLHRRLGAPRRPVAVRLGARDPRLACRPRRAYR